MSFEKLVSIRERKITFANIRLFWDQCEFLAVLDKMSQRSERYFRFCQSMENKMI